MSCITKEEKDFLVKVLHDMEKPSNDMEYLFGYQDEDDRVYCNYEEFVYEDESLFTDFNYGASKNVLYLNSEHDNDMIRKLAEKICIKIPMKYAEDGYEFDAASVPIRKINRQYKKTLNTSFTEIDWDYCNTEVQIYECAKQLGCEEPLAETFYITDVDGYPFYGAELMTPCEYCDYDSESDWRDFISSEETHQMVKNVTKRSYYDFGEKSLKYRFCVYYSLDVVLNFIKFFSEVRIYDIDPGRNCGRDPDGRIKILDYSDYND